VETGVKAVEDMPGDAAGKHLVVAVYKGVFH
jgi:hypothetical protein